MDAHYPPLAQRVAAITLTVLLFSSGCTHGIVSQRARVTSNAIPAHRLPAELAAPSKNNQVPVAFTRLRRTPVNDHVIGPHDVLGVYIEDVLAVENQLPTVFYPTDVTRAQIETPSVGHPTSVRTNGVIQLPLVGDVKVEGLTIPEAIDKIRRILAEKSIVKDNAVISLDLIRARTIKVFVIREDTGPVTPSLLRRDTHVLAKRGSADAFDLPVFENDLLHALSLSGGLPGTDGYNEVWILRGDGMSEVERGDAMSTLQNNPDAGTLANDSRFVRIPLRVCPGQELPFTEQDIILHDGDVVFVESREREYFTTGGLIQGGKYPLPRDHDVDILEAIAIANSNVVGPAGSVNTTFRSGPGNFLSPSRVIVVRSLPSGEQVKIEVDLRAAVNDPNERIAVMPKDLIVLKFKPHELIGNTLANFINVGYTID